jgi:hypothetical protein
LALGYSCFARFCYLSSVGCDIIGLLRSDYGVTLENAAARDICGSCSDVLHWASLHSWEHPLAAIVHFAPLASLETYRVWYWYLRPSSKAIAA